MAHDKVRVKVIVPAGLRDDLDALAEKRGISWSALVRQAIERMIEATENAEAPRIRHRSQVYK